MEDIRIVFDESNSQSLAYFDDKPIGECQFEIKDNKWYIIHTGVRPEFGGRGVARLLVERLVLEAQKRNIEIIPICSYAQKIIQK